MRWIKDPYAGPLIRRKKDEVIRSIDEGDYPGGVYVIMLALNGTDYLDIRRATSLVHSYIEEADPLMAGIAASKTEAIAVLEKMTQDCWKKRSDANLRAFVLELYNEDRG